MTNNIEEFKKSIIQMSTVELKKLQTQYTQNLANMILYTPEEMDNLIVQLDIINSIIEGRQNG